MEHGTAGVTLEPRKPPVVKLTCSRGELGVRGFFHLKLSFHGQR